MKRGLSWNQMPALHQGVAEAVVRAALKHERITYLQFVVGWKDCTTFGSENLGQYNESTVWSAVGNSNQGRSCSCYSGPNERIRSIPAVIPVISVVNGAYYLRISKEQIEYGVTSFWNELNKTKVSIWIWRNSIPYRHTVTTTQREVSGRPASSRIILAHWTVLARLTTICGLTWGNSGLKRMQLDN